MQNKKWSVGKRIRFFFFGITNFAIYGFGFAFPEERDEFMDKINSNETIY